MSRSLISVVIAFLLLMAASGAYVFAYLRLQADTASAAKLSEQVKVKSIDLEQLARSHAALADLPTQEAAVEQYFVSKQDIVPFLEALQATGKGLGTTVSVLSVDDGSEPTHARFSLSLTVTGSFDGVMKTIGAIENGAYDGVLTNVTIDSSAADPKGARVWTAAVVLSLGEASASTTPTQP